MDNDLVFASQCYTELHAANVRRAFRTVAVDADPAGCRRRWMRDQLHVPVHCVQ